MAKILNNMKISFLSIIFCVIFFCSCATYRTPPINSKFTSEVVKLGITKDAFISKFGKPFKESFSVDKDNIRHDTLYYKEFMGSWYAVNTIFHFENFTLVSQEQGDEERMYQECNCSSKK